MDNEHHLLAQLVGSGGWELMKAVINERVRVYYAHLLDPSQDRKDKISDDYLRGAIQDLKWVVLYPELEIKAARDEEIAAETVAREAAEIIPLFGGGRPASGNGETHGRDEGSGG